MLIIFGYQRSPAIGTYWVSVEQETCLRLIGGTKVGDFEFRYVSNILVTLSPLPTVVVEC